MGEEVQRLTRPFHAAILPHALSENRSQQVALCDYLTRIFYKNCGQYSQGRRGTGKSGTITIDRPGQEVLESTAMVANNQSIEARFFMGLPAVGRRISGKIAAIMFLDELPGIVRQSLFFNRLDPVELQTHIHTAEDADTLRDGLSEMGLVGFVANGALLPRASGINPVPMADDRVVAFQSPGTLQKDILLPNSGSITGMGIPKGVTLIAGSGYHGKSTLLNALELGVYNHIPNDSLHPRRCHQKGASHRSNTCNRAHDRRGGYVWGAQKADAHL
jgi:predicted ABC-class ATPase